MSDNLDGFFGRIPGLQLVSRATEILRERPDLTYDQAKDLAAAEQAAKRELENKQ